MEGSKRNRAAEHIGKVSVSPPQGHLSDRGRASPVRYPSVVRTRFSGLEGAEPPGFNDPSPGWAVLDSSASAIPKTVLLSGGSLGVDGFSAIPVRAE